MPAPEKLVDAVVARGRTVHHQVKDGEPKAFGPGATVRLPESDVKSLRSLGFLRAAAADEVDEDAGPKIETGGAVSITHEE
jgi:hypothetical protein